MPVFTAEQKSQIEESLTAYPGLHYAWRPDETKPTTLHLNTESTSIRMKDVVAVLGTLEIVLEQSGHLHPEELNLILPDYS